MNELVGIEIRVERGIDDDEWKCLVMKKDAETGRGWCLMSDSSWHEYKAGYPADELTRLPLRFLRDRRKLRRLVRRHGIRLARSGSARFSSRMLWGGGLRERAKSRASKQGLER